MPNDTFREFFGSTGQDNVAVGTEDGGLVIKTGGVERARITSNGVGSGSFAGGGGSGLPPGGTAGQILAKNSATDGDAGWEDDPNNAKVGVPAGGTDGQLLGKSGGVVTWVNDPSGGKIGVPVGGTTGQLLAKNSNADGDIAWINDPSGAKIGVPVGGTTGQFLKKNSNADGDIGWAAAAAAALSAVLAVGADAGGIEITNLGAPVNSSDAATKGYIDLATFNNVSATTYTFVLTDVGKFVNFTSGTGCTVTIPNDSLVVWPTGAQIMVRAGSTAGSIVFQGDGTSAVHNPHSSLTLFGPYSEAKLIKIGPNAWSLNGDVV